MFVLNNLLKVKKDLDTRLPFEIISLSCGEDPVILRSHHNAEVMVAAASTALAISPASNLRQQALRGNAERPLLELAARLKGNVR